MAKSNDPARISPTAHYTGHIWQLHGLSTPVLATREGSLFYQAFRPLNAASRLFGGPTLTGMLLARHQAIDLLLTRAIDEGRVGQVLEVAAGYSPRGWRFKRKYGSRLNYVEADLPHMAERKQGLLKGVSPAERPSVIPINVLEEFGPLSLDAVTRDFDPSLGLAIITEGLVGYLEIDAVRTMWAGFARTLRRYPHGLFLTDLRTAIRTRDSVSATLFLKLLATFVRGRVHLHFTGEEDARRSMVAAGFASAAVHRLAELDPGLMKTLDRGADFVQIGEART